MVVSLATPLSLVAAEVAVNSALHYARTEGMSPLAVVVLDVGGHPIISKREDGAGILRLDVATAKAWTALGMGVQPKALGERLAGNPAFMNALIAASGGRVAPNAGGVLILNDQGQGIGAIGISGDTADNDEKCAITGLTVAGLKFSAEIAGL